MTASPHTVQASLFGAPPVPRRELAGGAWLEVHHEWLGRADNLLGQLLAQVPWRAERRRMYDRTLDVPRLVSFHDLTAGPPPHPVLESICDRLNGEYTAELGEQFTTVGLCQYRDGTDSVAWHGDTIGRGLREDTMVAIVSIGATRTFALRPRLGGESIRINVGHGDLLVMGGTCQRTWEHAIPKTSKPVGPRISLQYRPRDVR
ncbi:MULTISPECIES: alpha-ketoglutarate-dependent dioxygenase AlkB [unclassified Mycobacterium]|uniref:alpha-ketoglutarate-dependent dioxygenase AlkB family protein n=1 Tax=unclassified Mycobacterium TaxID=2642494 RepID=UPI0009948794|nr:MULTISPECIES: alpha-ketoglutarate-dependent dioxygenase AlkB [unclassified Mycobacterium]